jgi:hypothetical protein
VPHVRGQADHLQSRFGTEHQLLADRSFAGPKLARERLVDEEDGRLRLHVVLGEVAP